MGVAGVYVPLPLIASALLVDLDALGADGLEALHMAVCALFVGRFCILVAESPVQDVAGRVDPRSRA